MNEKKLGRPRAEQPSTTVCSWVPSSQHDRLIALAQKERASVSAYVRGLIERAVRPGQKS